MLNRGRANRRVIGLAMLFGVVTSLVGSRSVTLAKEFEMLGTIDCSLASGVTCPIGDSLTLWTTAISGTREPFVIDVSWIRNQIESGPQRQDDLLCLQVEERPGIGYRALSVDRKSTRLNSSH